MLSKKDFDGPGKQFRFKEATQDAISIQKSMPTDSIVASSSPIADFFDSINPKVASRFIRARSLY